MQSSTRLLLLFLLPILIVVLPLLVAGGIAKQVFHHQLVEHNERQSSDLGSLAEAAELGQGFGEIHERATHVLHAAIAGELSSLQLYRAHTSLVDDLASMNPAVDALADSPLLIEINHGSAQALRSVFNEYREFIVVATEIAVVDQGTALHNLNEASERFIQFSRFNQRISERLATRASERSEDSFVQMEGFMSTATVMALALMVVLSVLAFVCAQWLNRNLVAITQALLDMSSGRVLASTANIRRVQAMSEDSRHAFQPLATALMQLRMADQKRHKAEESVYQLAYFDALTGLANWSRLTVLLEAQLAQQSASNRLALLILDLDNFKDVNDSHGHRTGDLLLVEVAHRLAQEAKPHAIARLGGDEFAVLVTAQAGSEGLAEGDIEPLALTIRQALAEPYLIDGNSFFLTISMGIVIVDGTDYRVEDLFKHADSAMNRAKRLGRNAHCFFDPKVQFELEASSQLERELRVALESGEFCLHYQLQFDHQQRAIGAEALVRWQHPERGMMSPATFIQLAEETGLIVPLGYWVLAEACEQLSRWQISAETRSLSMAVNVSPQQFQDDDFCDRIVRILEATGANPALLKLELTESTLLSKVEDTITKMHSLKAKGLSFSLDDFGTGYSSLQYLKRLPISQLKIDQSFVFDLHRAPEDKAIVRTIIAMSKALQVQVIAEGVESQAQFDYLLSEGCYAFQGYYFSRPESVESINSRLNQRVTPGDG